jgi:hypothetical protein
MSGSEILIKSKSQCFQNLIVLCELARFLDFLLGEVTNPERRGK